MTNAEVQVGQVYLANVSGKRALVRIVSHDIHYYGRPTWMAKNLITGREIAVKSGRRLIRHISEDRVSSVLAIYSR